MRALVSPCFKRRTLMRVPQIGEGTKSPAHSLQGSGDGVSALTGGAEQKQRRKEVTGFTRLNMQRVLRLGAKDSRQ